MTVIQQASLPPILEGRDVVGRAFKTGSGKTAAFALGALELPRYDQSRDADPGPLSNP